MSKTEDAKGTLRTFAWLVGEEWTAMDHKLLRIIASVLGFVAFGLFWFYVLGNIMPF